MSDEKREMENPSDLVIVGAAGGNIEALTTFVSTLPKDFPAPIIFMQHLDFYRPTTLDLILQRRTTLPVHIVTATSKLEAGRLYLVPAHRKIIIHDSQITIQGDAQPRLWSSLDALLSDAAELYGERLIAVLLASSSSDGIAGAVEVKNAEGTVVIQDQKSAHRPSLPLTLPPTVVDFEVGIEQIGPLLYDLLMGTPINLPGERAEDTLQTLLEQVNQQVSIDFRPYKTATILRRIGRRMMVTHTRTMPAYLEYLQTYPEEVGELVKAFLINVTQFFRDPDAFAYLRSDILPRIITQARSSDRILRFWTAGCSTGEEPYSLAMLLTDMLGAELPEWSIKIFATDLDEAAINFARRGLYSENLFKGLPTDYKERFFERVDMGYRIAKTLRQW